LLLDEPTSALDTKNEAKFMKVLEEIIKTQCSMTVLIISHRLHITQITDKVLYLGKHNKVSYGTHKEVLQ
jgi:ABC-type multidrug transport system fused ATPase/permease subunit